MDDLIREIETVLFEADFDLSERCSECLRTADLAAVGEKRFLLKVTSNIDSFTKENARCMSAACRIVDAEPVLVGRRGHERMSDDVVYTRHEVRAMTPQALSSYIDGELLLTAERGGAKVNVCDISMLRHSHNMSRGQLARALGVSVTMIRKYESGSLPSPAVAQRLVSIFGDCVVKVPSLFRESRVYAEEINRAPFDIALKSSSLFLLSRDASSQRVATLKSFAHTLDAEPLLIGKKAEGIRTVALDELLTNYSC